MTKKKITSDESALFQEAMGHVKPLGKGSKAPDDHHHEKQVPKSQSEKTATEYFHDHRDADAVQHGCQLEYFNQSLSQQDRKRLKQGKLKIEETLDLHGYTAEEARDELADFLQEAQSFGYKCVRVVHGKGRPGTVPVLKNKINQWLPQSKYVLAYCSCLAKHGGSGAVYVLLRSK